MTCADCRVLDCSSSDTPAGTRGVFFYSCFAFARAVMYKTVTYAARLCENVSCSCVFSQATHPAVSMVMVHSEYANAALLIAHDKHQCGLLDNATWSVCQCCHTSCSSVVIHCAGASSPYKWHSSAASLLEDQTCNEEALLVLIAPPCRYHATANDAYICTCSWFG